MDARKLIKKINKSTSQINEDLPTKIIGFILSDKRQARYAEVEKVERSTHKTIPNSKEVKLVTTDIQYILNLALNPTLIPMDDLSHDYYHRVISWK